MDKYNSYGKSQKTCVINFLDSLFVYLHIDRTLGIDPESSWAGLDDRHDQCESV